MKENLKIYNILKLMNDGYSFISYVNNEEVTFFIDSDNVIAISNYYRLKLNKTDFMKLYKDNEFMLKEDIDKVKMDLNKDLEYYSKIQKRQ